MSTPGQMQGSYQPSQIQYSSGQHQQSKSHGGQGGTQVNNKYKTKRCWHFDNNGNCQMAEKCHFAHGDAELRELSQPIPYEQLA